MQKKLNSILLIEDDDATNYIHKLLITRLNCTNHIEVAKNGLEAIEYLTTSQNGDFPKPELILLDINMPKMNGWEFLEDYKKLDIKYRGNIVVVMVTTSVNIDDERKANSIKEVNGFKKKPMTFIMFQEILNQFFSEEKSVMN